jgi:hypothetical protein
MQSFRGGVFRLLALHADDATGLFGELPGFGTSPEPVDFVLGNKHVSIDVHWRDPATLAPTKARGSAPPYPAQPEVEIYACGWQKRRQEGSIRDRLMRNMTFA